MILKRGLDIPQNISQNVLHPHTQPYTNGDFFPLIQSRRKNRPKNLSYPDDQVRGQTGAGYSPMEAESDYYGGYVGQNTGRERILWDGFLEGWEGGQY